VRADGRHEQRLDARVHHAAPRRHAVGRRA
jgi:hypothetical protein